MVGYLIRIFGNRLKKGSFNLFVHCKWSRIIFGKPHFSSIFVYKTIHCRGMYAFLEGRNGPPQAENAPKTLAFAFHMVHDRF